MCVCVCGPTMCTRPCKHVFGHTRCKKNRGLRGWTSNIYNIYNIYGREAVLLLYWPTDCRALALRGFDSRIYGSWSDCSNVFFLHRGIRLNIWARVFIFMAFVTIIPMLQGQMIDVWRGHISVVCIVCQCGLMEWTPEQDCLRVLMSVRILNDVNSDVGHSIDFTWLNN